VKPFAHPHSPVARLCLLLLCLATITCHLVAQTVTEDPEPELDPEEEQFFDDDEDEGPIDPTPAVPLPVFPQLPPSVAPPGGTLSPTVRPQPATPPAIAPPAFPESRRASEPVRMPATLRSNVEPAGAQLPVVLNFPNAPLIQVFELYSQLTDRLVLYPSQLQTQTISLTTPPDLHLTPYEAILAIEGALALNGVTLIHQGERFVKAVPAAQSIMEGGAISQVDAEDLMDAEQFVTQVVQLKVAIPSEVAAVLGSFSKTPGGIVPIDSSMILVLRDYSSNVKRMRELIERVDVQPESHYVLEVIPIKYGKVIDFFTTMNALVGGSAGIGLGTGIGTTGTRATLPTTGGARGIGGTGTRGIGTTGGRTTGGFQSGAQRGIVQPYQAAVPTPAAPGQTTFQQRLQQIVSRAAGDDPVELLSDARIVPDERSNSLIVYANRQDMTMITNIVSKVDVLLAQVLIEGIVMAVNLGDEQEVGVSWLQRPRQFGSDFAGAGLINSGNPFLSALTNFPSGQPSGFSYFGRLGDDVDVSLRAFARDSNVRILQRPRVQTSHAVPGFFFSGSTVPYVTGFTDFGNIGGGFSTRSQVQQVEVGVRLEVVPYITPDGLVVLEIFQDISQLGEFVRIDNNDVPTTTSRNAAATLSVRDGETIILGGYIEDNRSSSKSGVPILKDIPGLGALFRSKSRRNSRTELILLMHVTILKNPDEAGLQAERAKLQLPGISAAEADFKKEEFKVPQF
jgi:general secretion pathway protein D